MTPPPHWHFSENSSDLVAGPFPESAQDWRTSSDLWRPFEELHNFESGQMEVSHMIEIFYGLACQELGMDPVGPWTLENRTWLYSRIISNHTWQEKKSVM